MRFKRARLMELPPVQLAGLAIQEAPDVMLFVDAGWIIRFTNCQVTAGFGYAPEELVVLGIERLVLERVRQRRMARRSEYLAHMRVRAMSTGLAGYVVRHHGTEFPVEIQLSLIKNGTEALVAAAIRDASDREHVAADLNAPLEDMQSLCKMSMQLMKVTDLSTIVGEILDAIVTLQAADFGEIQLRDPETGALQLVMQRGFSASFLDCFASIDSGNESAYGRSLSSGERVVIKDVQPDSEYLPFRAIAAQEGYRAVQFARIRGLDGVPIGILSTHFRQPHRPSERELQLTDLYMHLAATLIARGRADEAARAARDLANRANQAKSRFLATASHDLRQPLQTIALLNGVLRRTMRDEESGQALFQQEQAIGAMARLLNALLDISKLESGAVRPELGDFAVATLFEELRRDFAGIAAGKGLSFDIETCRCCVHSDPSLIEQVLRNLVANAIKYTLRGRVTLNCHVVSDSNIRIDVLDTGIGIPEEKLGYIYDEFYQIGVGSNSARDSYGLGLSIVKRIADLLGLKLEVRSQVGTGSCFSVLLPPAQGPVALASPRSGESGPLAQSPERRRTLKLLLVEDDPGVQDATRMLLKVAGYDVTAVSSLMDALAAACTGVDLLVTDYHLAGGETGTQVIAALRNTLGTSLKTVLVTGDTSSVIRELPCDQNLRVASKPLHAEELLRLLQSLMVADNPPDVSETNSAAFEASARPTL